VKGEGGRAVRRQRTVVGKVRDVSEVKQYPSGSG